VAKKHRDTAITVKVMGPTEADMTRAISVLKKKVQLAGTLRQLKLKTAHEKPSEKRKRKEKESEKRRRIIRAKQNRNR